MEIFCKTLSLLQKPTSNMAGSKRKLEGNPWSMFYILSTHEKKKYVSPIYPSAEAAFGEPFAKLMPGTDDELLQYLIKDIDAKLHGKNQTPFTQAQFLATKKEASFARARTRRASWFENHLYSTKPEPLSLDRDASLFVCYVAPKNRVRLQRATGQMAAVVTFWAADPRGLKGEYFATHFVVTQEDDWTQIAEKMWQVMYEFDKMEQEEFGAEADKKHNVVQKEAAEQRAKILKAQTEERAQLKLTEEELKEEAAEIAELKAHEDGYDGNTAINWEMPDGCSINPLYVIDLQAKKIVEALHGSKTKWPSEAFAAQESASWECRYEMCTSVAMFRTG